MKLIRGYVTLILVLLLLALSDPVQRFIIGPFVTLFPSKRTVVLTRWQKLMAAICTSPISFIGGVRFPPVPQVPTGPGRLILMNHQSVFDIPLVVRMVDGGYPRIITRRRYWKWIPLISHMLRLYQYLKVDPAANASEMRRQLEEIGEVARTSEFPIAVFPEGTRTKDGEIGRFRPRGLQTILKQRAWTVHVMVVDGFWERAKMMHFLRGMGDIRGSLKEIAVLEWTDPEAESDAFVRDIRERMVAALAEMRDMAAA